MDIPVSIRRTRVSIRSIRRLPTAGTTIGATLGAIATGTMMIARVTTAMIRDRAMGMARARRVATMRRRASPTTTPRRDHARRGTTIAEMTAGRAIDGMGAEDYHARWIEVALRASLTDVDEWLSFPPSSSVSDQ